MGYFCNSNIIIASITCISWWICACFKSGYLLGTVKQFNTISRKPIRIKNFRDPQRLYAEIICYSNLPLILSINNKAESKIGSYLAGLIEGDGTIIVPKTERSPKGKLNYPSIQIVFHLKDFPLALMIQKILGFGSIIRKKGVNAYIYTIDNNEGLISIVNLINGKLRTPKIYAFQNLID